MLNKLLDTIQGFPLLGFVTGLSVFVHMLIKVHSYWRELKKERSAQRSHDDEAKG